MTSKVDALKGLLNIKENTGRYPVEIYYDVLESINALVYNYTDWLGDQDVDKQLKKLDKADYNLACAIITLVLREDYWINGAFDRRFNAGEVTPIIKKMISELENERTTLEWSNPITFAELYEQNFSSVPHEPGVYRIVCLGYGMLPLNRNSSNSSVVTYDVEMLQKKYDNCIDKKILYIGKANGKKGLYQRIRQYVLYGYDKSKIHKGGRAIWQLDNAKNLMIEYACINNPEEVEKSLLKKYSKQNKGTLPFANWRL